MATQSAAVGRRTRRVHPRGLPNPLPVPVAELVDVQEARVVVSVVAVEVAQVAPKAHRPREAPGAVVVEGTP